MLRQRSDVSGVDNLPGWRMFSGRAQAARDLDGYAAATWSLRGQVKVVFAFTVEDGLIRRIELLAGDLERLDLR